MMIVSALAKLMLQRMLQTDRLGVLDDDRFGTGVLLHRAHNMGTSSGIAEIIE
jgi:hypothetical protein